MKEESFNTVKKDASVSLLVAIWKAIHPQPHHDVASSFLFMSLWGELKLAVDEPRHDQTDCDTNNHHITHPHGFRVNQEFHYRRS